MGKTSATKATRLRIFLSYSSAQETVAEAVEMALTTSGHDVFFDRTDLPSGDEFHIAIRRAIQSSDLFVFLISPESISKGKYTRTELRYARETWPNPVGRILPVMVVETDMGAIPEYLKSVTIFYPEGNLAAELTAVINDLAMGTSPKNTISEQVARYENEIKELQRQQKLLEIDQDWQREKEENGWDIPQNRENLFNILISGNSYRKAEANYLARRQRALSNEDEPVFGKYLMDE